MGSDNRIFSFDPKSKTTIIVEWDLSGNNPHGEILDITTMCGHGMISFNLVRRIAVEVKRKLRSIEEAGRIMAKPCTCGVFNPIRSEELLRQYIARNP